MFMSIPYRVCMGYYQKYSNSYKSSGHIGNINSSKFTVV